MVVAGENIRNQRAEHIEGSLMADALFDLHVGCDFIHSHVSRAFDHDLHILVPGTLSESAQLDQLRDLTGIGTII